MNIYVGNLPQEVKDEDLKKTFEVYGEVASAKVIKDNFLGESRGFGFVDMPVKEEAMEAMKELNGQEVHGKHIIVNEARPRKDTRRKKGRGGRKGGGGYGGGGGYRSW